jgi:hypothetical protein
MQYSLIRSQRKRRESNIIASIIQTLAAILAIAASLTILTFTGGRLSLFGMDSGSFSKTTSQDNGFV